MKCWYCSSEVVWQSDFSYEDYNYEGEGIVTILTCSNENCRAEYESRLPLDKEE